MVATACGTLAYTVSGSGEALLLIHGLGTTRRTWRHLIASLATQYTVIVPDLPGHGDSGPPAGDYSLGAHATALRDVLVALGHQRATVIGHSLGGGVAMQFAYQFPERTSRLVLISSGGFGAELTVLLRAAALPGAQAVVGVIARLPEPLTRLGLTILSAGPGLLARQDAGPLAAGLRGLADAQQRRTFVRTARCVIDWHGQAVSASERFWFLAELPVLLAWGSNDKIIPARHHRMTITRLPHSHSIEIPDAGHCPQETTPEELLTAIHRFLLDTKPFQYDEARWRQLVTGERQTVRTVTPAPSGRIRAVAAQVH